MRAELSSWQLALLAAVFVIVTNNPAVFQALNEKTDFGSIESIGVYLTLFLLLTGVLWFGFLIVGAGKLLKPVICTVILLSAALGYFTNKLGTVFDHEMIRNIVETARDANAAEARELMSASFGLYLLTFGILPSGLVIATKLTKATALGELLKRTVCLTAGLAVIVPMCLLNYKGLTGFGIDNRDLRFKLTPIFALSSVKSFLDLGVDERTREFQVFGADATQNQSDRGRIVGVMVVGETARADHFSLNGYERETNPELASEPDLLFFEAASCGTSTAYSVPCMFFLRGRSNYNPDLAANESNVLDVLTQADVNVVWIDINSSCKGVCERIASIDPRNTTSEPSLQNDEGGHYDAALLPHLSAYLDNQKSDVLVVLHMIGSHGPAYSRRYPNQFSVFQPSCKNNAPQLCDDGELINAYDNTIVYTDHILGQIIDILRQREDTVRSFMFYASDHGESLGENGIYLHGLPYAIAPKAQTRIPMIIWMSQELLATKASGSSDGASVSHDNISHTLLGLFDVSTEIYQEQLDLLRPMQKLAADRS